MRITSRRSAGPAVRVHGRAPNFGDSYALWRVMGTGARRGQRTALVRREAGRRKTGKVGSKVLRALWAEQLLVSTRPSASYRSAVERPGRRERTVHTPPCAWCRHRVACGRLSAARSPGGLTRESGRTARGGPSACVQQGLCTVCSRLVASAPRDSSKHSGTVRRTTAAALCAHAVGERSVPDGARLLFSTSARATGRRAPAGGSCTREPAGGRSETGRAGRNTSTIHRVQVLPCPLLRGSAVDPEVGQSEQHLDH